MSAIKNILVTGAGALLGQGILRSLRRVKGHPLRIISADPDHRATGHWLSDSAVLIPMAKDPEYLPAIEKVIEEYKIDLLLVGTDVELFIFTENKVDLESRYGCTIVVSPRDTIQIGDNKWDTVRFLKAHGFRYPDSALSNQPDELGSLIGRVGLPLFAKPTVGARSVGVKIVEQESDLQPLMDEKGEYIIQELLDPQEGEYTAGTMVFEGRILFTIILRRDLRGGNTYRAYPVKDTGLYSKLESIIHKLDIYGPCNFQFRMRNNEPVIFEINSRFSGTTPIRDFFGINELQVLLDYLYKGEVSVNPEIRDGAVFRTFSDLFVPSDQLTKFEQEGKLSNPGATYHPFLDS